MCGIAGIAGEIAPEEARARVSRMIGALQHRGPDDQGVWVSDLGRESVCLGNTRLAVIDLTPAGHMPMRDPETSNVITYNGEIYNFAELRSLLERLGCKFRSATDTEVLLQTVGRWGWDGLRLTRGMFAFGVWVASRRELWLVRDPVGKKPLYWWAGNGVVAFASEVRALLSSGLVERRLNPAGLETYLANGFTVAPLTLVQGIRSLLPGQGLRVRLAGGAEAEEVSWAAAAESPPDVIPPPWEVREAFGRAVARRLVSDVPLGIFLSSGTDSRAIAWAAASAGADVVCLTVRVADPELDESEAAAGWAKKLGLRHVVVDVSDGDLQRLAFEALDAMDQPSFDGLNTCIVARAARKAGLTVALSGLGGDELFGGYPWLRAAVALSRSVPALPRGILARGIGILMTRRLSGLWKVGELFTSSDGLPASLAAYQATQVLFPFSARRALLAPSLSPQDGEVVGGLPAPFVSWLQRQLVGPAWDCAGRIAERLFLAERTLRDTDAQSMAVALEVRAPFTDLDLVRLVHSVPARARMVRAKAYLRQLLPPELGGEPSSAKRGFVLPFTRFLRHESSLERIDDILARPGVQDLGLDSDAVGRCFQAWAAGAPRIPWSRIWALVALCHWLRANRMGV